MSIDQLARDQPSLELVRRRRAWKDGYPWLDRAFQEIGQGARAASDGWRVRIEEDLKTTLDFKVRSDGTAVVWCGMSGYDFNHHPTTNELFKGLAEAYRRELTRRRLQLANSQGRRIEGSRAPDPLRPQASAVRALPPLTWCSLARALATVLVPRIEDLVAIFLAVTGLTLALATVAIAVN